MSAPHDRSAIADLLDRYVEGARTGSAEAVEAVFEPTARIRGSLHGTPVDRSAAEFGAFVADRGAARTLQAEPPRIDVVGDAASARLECLDWHGIRYTDLFTLLRRDGRWRIVSKVFHAHADA